MPHGHGCFLRSSFLKTRIPARPYPGLEELGQIQCNRVIKLEAAFFVQHHGGHRRDRLGHRIGANDGIVGKGLRRFQVGMPDRLLINNLTMASDQGTATGQPISPHLLLKPGSNSAESF